MSTLGRMSGNAGRKVVVVGQGYVGLPLAVRAVEVGHQVVGYEGRIKRLARFVELANEALRV